MTALAACGGHTSTATGAPTVSAGAKPGVVLAKTSDIPDQKVDGDTIALA
ncbi:hypothetical protein [Herbidospora cretacea]|nr:hypothetical protein [Herbidospora cretacea]